MVVALGVSIMQGILSGRVALLRSTSDNSLSIGWVFIWLGGIVVCGDVGM